MAVQRRIHPGYEEPPTEQAPLAAAQGERRAIFVTAQGKFYHAESGCRRLNFASEIRQLLPCARCFSGVKRGSKRPTASECEPPW